MDMNSIENSNALTEQQKDIQIIEKKIQRLNFVPVVCCSILLGYALWLLFSNNQSLSPADLVVVAVIIGNVGYSNVQRTDLLIQLMELKYDK